MKRLMTLLQLTTVAGKAERLLSQEHKCRTLILTKQADSSCNHDAAGLIKTPLQTDENLGLEAIFEVILMMALTVLVNQRTVC